MAGIKLEETRDPGNGMEKKVPKGEKEGENQKLPGS